MRTRPIALYSSLLVSAVFFGFSFAEVGRASENEASSVPSARRRIADGAGLFTEETIEKGKGIIMRIKRLYKVSVFLETIDDIPETDERRINSAKNPAREFLAWASTRAATARVDGIYILISVDPHHKNTVVVVRPQEEYKEMFTREDAEELRRRFASRSFLQKPNQSLLDGLESINDTLHSNGESPLSIPWRTLGLLFVGGVGVWLLLSLLRLKSRQEDDDDPPNNTNGGSGGHLYPSLLGGLFGMLAGQAMYEEGAKHPPTDQARVSVRSPDDNVDR